MEKSDSIIIIPTYNEKENIEKIIRAIFGLEKYFHILVIDDGSPDGTANIVHHLMEDEFKGRLFIVERSGKLGLGTAYIAGFKWALERAHQEPGMKPGLFYKDLIGNFNKQVSEVIDQISNAD